MTGLLGPDGLPYASRKDQLIDTVSGEEVVTYIARGHYNRLPWFTKRMRPIGKLPREYAAAALWWFIMLAHRVMMDTPIQTTLEGDEDTFVNLRNLAASTAMMYDVTLEDMFSRRLLEAAREETADKPFKIHPKIETFIRSGGTVYAEWDREPM